MGAVLNALLPRLGFLGTGWIGRHRMEAVKLAGAGAITAIADASDDAARDALKAAPGALRVGSLEDMLELDLDGIVIATPSALHAAQAIAALGAGKAVFCQKPLGRSLTEVEAVIAAARRADRLLDIDFCYRRTEAMQRIRDALHSEAIGRVFAAEFTFHNAYGPDKAWFYDPAQSGGGCLADLGSHLIDLALWTFAPRRVVAVHGWTSAGGEPGLGQGVEDFARAMLVFDDGATASIDCSWKLHAGQDAVIGARFHGSGAGLAFTNVSGSFYDFVAERMDGTQKAVLTGGPDDWGGRTIVAWAERLSRDRSFDVAVDSAADVARIIDEVYRQAGDTRARQAA